MEKISLSQESHQTQAIQSTKLEWKAPGLVVMGVGVTSVGVGGGSDATYGS